MSRPGEQAAVSMTSAWQWYEVPVATKDSERESTNTGRGRSSEAAPPFRHAKTKAFVPLMVQNDSRASKKSFNQDNQNAVATSSPKASHLPHRLTISTSVYTTPHSDKLIHNLGPRTGAKERHHRQRHRSRPLVRTIMARERCPYDTAISEPRRRHLGYRHDRRCCDSPLARSLQRRQQDRRIQPRL
jgi:hypothetical protein